MWYRRAAEAGHKAAARSLGLMFLTGAGVPRTRARRHAGSGAPARRAGTRAPRPGQPGAAGRAASRRIPTRIAGWFEQAAAAAGDLVAAFNSDSAWRGRGRRPRRAAGRALAAPRRRGRSRGAVHVRPMLAGGPRRGPPTWRRPAMVGAGRRGRPGRCPGGARRDARQNGRGGRATRPGRVALFRRGGHPRPRGAMFALGALFGGGHDLPGDRPQAQRWFRPAAELGHAHAQMMLGRYLAAGVAGQRTRRRRACGRKGPGPGPQRRPGRPCRPPRPPPPWRRPHPFRAPPASI